MKSKKKVSFKTFGCRTNIYDTALLKEKLKDHIEVDENEADCLIVNSCTVTNGADMNVRQYINKVKRENPNVKIYFTGCGSNTSMAKKLYDENSVFSVFTADYKENIAKMLESDDKIFKKGSLTHIDDTIVSSMRGKTKGFVKIQEGCDFSCNYCIIPQVRGSSRSIGVYTIIEQIENLVSSGSCEIVLTGTNIGSYGKGIDGMNLPKLLKKISQVRGVKRVRMGSIEPLHVTDELKEILKEKWFNRHLHIALQHSNDEMLKIMNRRNRVKHDMELLNDLYENYNIAIGTDYIVGHPGESNEVWNDAVSNLGSYKLTHIHPFRYSKRENTVSASLKGDINGKISSDRLHSLEDIISNKNYDFRKKNNSLKLDILVEQFKDDYYVGYDQFFNKMFIESDSNLIGKMVEINDYKVKDRGNYCVYKK